MTQVTKDELAGLIGEAVGKAMADAKTDTETKDSAGQMIQKSPAAPVSVDDKEMQKAAPVRHLVGSMIQRQVGGDLESVIEKAYGEQTAAYFKATHQLTDYATGGALSLPDFADFIIEGLDNMTVVRRMNPTQLNVPGALVIPNETSAPDGSELSENDPAAVENFEFGDIRLDPKRIAVESVISNRLIRQAAQGQSAIRNLENYVVRRLRSRMAVKEDTNFLNGNGAANKVLGLRYQIVAGNQFAMTTTSSATREKDIRDMPTKLENANIAITGGHYLMSPNSFAALSVLRDANGNLVYPSLSSDGTIYGYAVIKSNQVANDEIMFFDGPSILVANESDARLTISTEGSYEVSGSARSLISRDETLIHMETYSDVKLERTTAGVLLTGVSFA